MKPLHIFIAQIPEAIFFSLFMIYTKKIKDKKIIYIILMIIEYLILKKFFSYNVIMQILYTFLSYIILKMLYKEKSQIIDIFTFTIASIIIIVTSAIMFFIANATFKNLDVCIILHKVLLFTLLYIFKDKLYNIQLLYKKLWNRKLNKKYMIKTTTFRAINVIVFNIMFYIINFGMLFILIKNGGV